MKIKSIKALEILDSRGNPTVSCTLELDNGTVTRASVPSGASVGKFEAVELRDSDDVWYRGRGVSKVIRNIEDIIAPALVGQSPDVKACDDVMLALDGTENKSKLGANAILPVSMVVARAQAACENKPLHLLLGELVGETQTNLPLVMFNVLNGGEHATNNIRFQEFMIMPIRGDLFRDRLHVASQAYHELKKLLVASGYSTGVGDEGGFAPKIDDKGQYPEREALDLLSQAVEKSGFELGRDVVFCLDVAASQFFDSQHKRYMLHGESLDATDIISLYKELINEYPIYSIEDGLDEADWEGWGELTRDIRERVMLVGDDIFVSNPLRIAQGVERGIANAVLIKPNQIGSVSEVLDAICLCKKHNYSIVVSHRSGETCDTFISDLVVGVGAKYFKAGAPARSERVAKYNRLLEIEAVAAHF